MGISIFMSPPPMTLPMWNTHPSMYAIMIASIMSVTATTCSLRPSPIRGRIPTIRAMMNNEPLRWSAMIPSFMSVYIASIIPRAKTARAMAIIPCAFSGGIIFLVSPIRVRVCFLGTVSYLLVVCRGFVLVCRVWLVRF